MSVWLSPCVSLMEDVDDRMTDPMCLKADGFPKRFPPKLVEFLREVGAG